MISPSNLSIMYFLVLTIPHNAILFSHVCSLFQAFKCILFFLVLLIVQLILQLIPPSVFFFVSWMKCIYQVKGMLLYKSVLCPMLLAFLYHGQDLTRPHAAELSLSACPVCHVQDITRLGSVLWAFHPCPSHIPSRSAIPFFLSRLPQMNFKFSQEVLQVV